MQNFLLFNNAAPCTSTWIGHADSNVPGGMVISTAADVPACQSACVQYPNCTGIDFNPSAPATSRCFLMFDDDPLMNEGLMKGVTHYDRVIDCNDTEPVSHSAYDSELVTLLITSACSCRHGRTRRPYLLTKK